MIEQRWDRLADGERAFFNRIAMVARGNDTPRSQILRNSGPYFASYSSIEISLDFLSNEYSSKNLPLLSVFVHLISRNSNTITFWKNAG